MTKRILLSLFFGLIPTAAILAGRQKPAFFPALKMSTYSVDQSDYSPRDSDFEKDDDWINPSGLEGGPGQNFESVELQPVPMSKNSGNRVVAFIWDRLLDAEKRDAYELHLDRIEHTEDHVMYCRKTNLYNETFNQDSMVDVLWSRQILSSDLQRVIGQAICLESSDLGYIKDFLQQEPLIQFFTGGDISEIPIYRWRHIRDYSLRRDDGRYGTPAMLLAFDHDTEPAIDGIRQKSNETHLEYLIRSERVIAAGPLHVCTDLKDDPLSLPVGDLVLFNAMDREEAINFVEEEPRAQGGLYKSMQVHFYNNLDVTGKFVAENRMDYEPVADMKEAMEYWGYPVADEQTPWLNW